MSFMEQCLLRRSEEVYPGRRKEVMQFVIEIDYVFNSVIMNPFLF